MMSDSISKLTNPVSPATIPAEAPKGRVEDAQVSDNLKLEAGTDKFVLSPQAEKELSSAEFDQALVDRVKAAMADGSYPVDARKVAEKFVALESMIYGK